MDGLRYRPGAWIALVRDSRLVLLPPQTSQERVDELWSALSSGPSLDGVFQAVTGALADSPLSQLPPFALLSVDGQVNVLLRGPLELSIAGQDGPAATGAHLRTWSEQVLPAAGLAVLTPVPQDDAANARLPLLTLREGMAAVSRIELDLDAAAAESPAASTGVGVPAPPAPGVTPAPAVTPVPAVTPAPVAAPTLASPPAPPVPPTPAEPAEPASGGPDLSSAVPWLKLTPPPLAAEAPERAAPQEPPVQTPAPQAEEDAPTETLPPVLEDHDGETIMGFSPQPGTAVPGTPRLDQLPHDEAAEDGETIRSAPAASGGQPSAAAKESGPTVLARTCPQGHVNPPTAGHCQACGRELSGEPAPAPRPSLGVMRLSTGAVFELDRNFVIGRQPSASRVQGAVLPKMVQVPSDSGDISRSHAEIRLEGWHVMLRDLFSTNGTVLVREGQLPRRLAQGEAAILLDGDVAELGDNVSIRFEGLA